MKKKYLLINKKCRSEKLGGMRIRTNKPLLCDSFRTNFSERIQTRDLVTEVFYVGNLAVRKEIATHLVDAATIFTFSRGDVDFPFSDVTKFLYEGKRHGDWRDRATWTRHFRRLALREAEWKLIERGGRARGRRDGRTLSAAEP